MTKEKLANWIDNLLGIEVAILSFLAMASLVTIKEPIGETFGNMGMIVFMACILTDGISNFFWMQRTETQN